MIEVTPKTFPGSLLIERNLQPEDLDFIVLKGQSNVELADGVGRYFGIPVHQTIEERFADGEPNIQIPVNVRNKDVFVIQSTCPPVAESLIDLQAILQAAKLGSARNICAVVPYFGYARQDRKPKSRTPITAKLAAQDIEKAGATHMLSVDIHNDALQGYVDIPWDFVYASKVFVPLLEEELDPQNLVVVSPDKGGFERATAYARRLRAKGVAVVFKQRDVDIANESEAVDMIGDVQDKDALIVDDILDTAGTLVNAANLVMERGARSVRAAITHGLFSGAALKRVNDSTLTRIWITNTVPLRVDHEIISMADVAPLLAEGILCVHTGESISERLFI